MKFYVLGEYAVSRELVLQGLEELVIDPVCRVEHDENSEIQPIC